jgi:thiol-disulfide isomerase/thioredoxin
MNFARLFGMIALCLTADGQSTDYDKLLVQAKSELAAGQMDQALTDSRKAIALDANRWDAHMIAGYALQAKKRYDDAIAEFSSAQEYAPPDKKADAKRFLDQCRSEKAANEGKELDATEPNGEHFLLSAYRGKAVIIEFLFTSCPHCQEYSKLLTKLQKDYGPKGLQCLGVAFGVVDQPAAVSSFIRESKVGFPVGSVQRDVVEKFLGFTNRRYSVPIVALIDRKGQIREQSVPLPTGEPAYKESYLRAAIEKLLKEP